MPVPAKGKGGKPKGKVINPPAAETEAPAEKPEAKEEEKHSAAPEAELKMIEAQQCGSSFMRTGLRVMNNSPPL